MLTVNTAYGELIKMIKQEFFKILKSPKSLLTYILICAISIGDSVYAILNSGESGMFGNSHPAMVSLFSAQTTVITRIAFFWVMPVYLMLFYADKYAVEKSCKIIKKSVDGFIFWWYSITCPRERGREIRNLAEK